jgi:catecholate siderophore receptor
MTSVRAGLTYKPVRAGSIYGSYGTSLTPSLDGLSYSTSNTAIPPEKTYTSEFGAKWDLIGGRMLASGAVFRVAKDNARTPGLLPTDPPQVLAGRQVSKGLELSLTGALTRSIRVLGAYTLIDAKINSSNTPAEVGKFFQNTPRHSASIWATYSRDRFSFGIGPRFMSKRYGNNTNTRVVDGYGTLDAMAGYTINRHLDLRLNLSNLNNAFYFDRLGGGHLIPAAGRTVLMTTNFSF